MTDDELKRAVADLTPEKRADAEAFVDDAHASRETAKAELDRTIRGLLDVDRMTFVALSAALAESLTVCLASNLMEARTYHGPEGEQIARKFAAEILLAVELSIKGVEPHLMAKAPKGVM